MVEKLTKKARKDDILEAYNELAAKYDKKEKEVDEHKPTESIAKKETKKVKDSKYTVETIVKGLANLKLDLNKTLTDISDKLISEVNTLEAIKKEIKLETEHLDDIHNIQIEADSLKNIMQMNEDKKASIEREITSIRDQWAKQQAEHELTVKERDEKLSKERERDHDEYNYDLSRKRKKEKDAYEEEKTTLRKNLAQERELKMKELSERETEIQAQEEELAELKSQVKNFPIELSKTIEKVKQETKNQIEKEMKHGEELQRREADGDKTVYELKIKNLEETMMKQALQIEGLTKQLDTSSEQVLNIANKAIEGASGIKSSTSFHDDLFHDIEKDEKPRK
ncbi:MAG: hypothetical protein U9R21_01980 [Candidatus Thermoplasmatota archaeon]|nr:hypothetical protein [Candidatus Thermoplasmatota archaeon]